MAQHDRPTLGILFVCAGVLLISLNDLTIKYLSGGYPLHQLVFIRAVCGLLLTFVFLSHEGGLRALRTDKPFLLILRGLLIVMANLTFFAALAVMPLGQVTALFFVAPLLITLLSVPLLGERVGPLRLGAVLVGFVGVLVMQRPWADATDAPRVVMALPVIAATFYALMQVLTRRLGVSASTATMAIYNQSVFVAVSLLFFAVAGDGRFVAETTPASLEFLLRPWIRPPAEEIWFLVFLGFVAGFMVYAMTAAYRLADAAVIAPFEYLGLPLAFFWGWLIFGEIPDATTWIGCALILGSGLFVFLRERRKGHRQLGRRGLWARR
ncbi:DMT family transporter [Thalassococcus sp. CAU 1522]|uniref:DMT family transporter n=1 Tax=Thalassococcus arenae TaxID=2851652 RepID=A0ABS6N7G5_9RHOB|nr:DMT family transporter [Thalassococcus arenae]MBV2359937.1 DMT family transporter [Thalassococcus arenae]